MIHLGHGSILQYFSRDKKYCSNFCVLNFEYNIFVSGKILEDVPVTTRMNYVNSSHNPFLKMILKKKNPKTKRYVAKLMLLSVCESIPLKFNMLPPLSVIFLLHGHG